MAGLYGAVSNVLTGFGNPSVLVYGSGNFTHNSTGNALNITWDTEARDTDGMHSLAANTDRLTVLVAGLYVVSAGFRWDTNIAGTRQTRINQNNSAGTRLASAVEQSAAPVASTYSQVTGMFEAAIGDYFVVDAYQNSGANRTIDLTRTPGGGYFGAFLISSLP